MEKFIDAYIKLVTQSLTFLAPIITLMLAEYSQGKKRIAEKKEKKDKELQERVLNAPKILGNVVHYLKETLDEYEKTDKNIVTEETLFNPRIQVPKIFGSLLLSLMLAMSIFLVGDFIVDKYKTLIQIVLMFFSLLLYICGISIISRIVWKIINTKEIGEGKKD